jgi:phytanoyl-CoA hydroxylase
MLCTHVQYGLSPEYRLSVAIEEANDISFNNDVGFNNDAYLGSDPRFLERCKELGYVVVRELVQPSLCDEVVNAFRREVKPFGGTLLRQASARQGPHLFTTGGFMANALLSVQDLVDRSFRQFRTRAIDVMAGQHTQRLIRELLMNAPLLIESMYFESTLIGIPFHADGDYMDSNVPGTMLGAWFALEDIAPLAGRFVLVPRSHRLEGGDGRAATAYREFRTRHARTSATSGSDMRTNVKRRLEEAALLHRAISENGLPVIAPMLEKGDAVFWSAGLIHGSLPPESRDRSRNSLTAHYIANTQELVVYGRCIDFPRETHHGMELRMMQDQGLREQSL